MTPPKEGPPKLKGEKKNNRSNTVTLSRMK